MVFAECVCVCVCVCVCDSVFVILLFPFFCALLANLCCYPLTTCRVLCLGCMWVSWVDVCGCSVFVTLSWMYVGGLSWMCVGAFFVLDVCGCSVLRLSLDHELVRCVDCVMNHFTLLSV